MPASSPASDEKHPLDIASLRETGAESHAFSGDLYALPPGVVSAHRFHFGEADGRNSRRTMRQ
jgi:hypothetical protein